MHEAQIFTHYLINNKPPLCLIKLDVENINSADSC